MAITTAIAIPNPSYHGANPRSAKKIVTKRATINMRIIGSFKFEINFLKNPSESWVVIIFAP